MKKLSAIAIVALLAGCATVPETPAEPKAESPKPAAEVKPAAKPEAKPAAKPVVKEQPYSDYGSAMASVANDPMAVEWQNKADAAIKAATAPEALKAYVMTPAAADALLAKVKGAYATDPLDATVIAAVSQLVMCTKWDKAPAARVIWTGALLRAAEGSTDVYRTLFFLDQMRWCGTKDQAARVAAIGMKANDRNVDAFARFVIRELK